ncbi:MAG: polysaccharide biosynthesis protein [Clostridiales bacterium]|nr:polysaccharide biosynthesis protein [Clostridiales bacterium]
MNKSKTDSTFIQQASILAAAALISRLIGFIYKLPLTNMIGDEGMGLYGAGYQIYNLLIILSSAGLPAAISKMVSERLALGQFRNAHKVYEVSLFASSALGILCSVVLFTASKSIALSFSGAQASPNLDSMLTIRTLAPTIAVVAVMSVYRGYYQGLGSTMPTAVSQIIEQIVNAVSSVALAWYLMKTFNHIKYGAAGGTAGTGIGAVFGLIFILLVYRMYLPVIRNKTEKQRGIIVSESKRKILRELLSTVFPIIAGTAIFSFTNIVDTQMVLGRLQEYMPYEKALGLYGQLSNKFVSLSTLPVSISSAIATASIPSIAASRVLKKSRDTSDKINTAMRVSMVISIPSAVGLGVLGNQILLMLFKSYPEGGLLLQIGAASIIFLALYQITTGMLQALNKVRVPMFAVVAGVAVKIPLNYFLLGVPEINILGAVISTIVCYVISSAVEIVILVRLTKIRLDIAGMLVRPLASSAAMGMACFVCYHLLYYIVPSNTLCTLFAIAAGLASYFFMMLLVGGFKAGDIALMPKGGSILRLFERAGIAGMLR